MMSTTVDTLGVSTIYVFTFYGVFGDMTSRTCDTVGVSMARALTFIMCLPTRCRRCSIIYALRNLISSLYNAAGNVMSRIPETLARCKTDLKMEACAAEGS